MFIGDDTTKLDTFRQLVAVREEGVLQEILRVGVRSDVRAAGDRLRGRRYSRGRRGVGEVLRKLTAKLVALPE